MFFKKFWRDSCTPHATTVHPPLGHGISMSDRWPTVARAARVLACYRHGGGTWPAPSHRGGLVLVDAGICDGRLRGADNRHRGFGMVAGDSPPRRVWSWVILTVFFYSKISGFDRGLPCWIAGGRTLKTGSDGGCMIRLMSRIDVL